MIHSIRSRIALVSATIAGDIAPHGVTGTYSSSSPPFAISGQPASSGFIVVARAFYSGAHFPSSRIHENPLRNDSDLLPGVAEAKKILGS